MVKDTEGFMSQWNNYILAHAMAYMLCFAVIILALLMEWIGFLFYSVPREEHNMFLMLFAQAGDVGFVIFITAAFVFPAGSFTVILFALGVTKLMRPEVLLAIWTIGNLESSESAANGRMTLIRGSRISARTRLRREQSIRNYARAQSIRESHAMDVPHNAPAAGEANAVSGAEAGQSLADVAIDVSHQLADAASDAASGAASVIEGAKNATQDLIWWEWFSVLAQGIGLLLHHSTMSFIFATGSLHLNFTDPSLEQFGVLSVLGFVLSQHFISQIIPAPTLLRNAILLLIEIFFQWYVFSSLSHVGSTMLAVGLLCLAISHWLFILSVVVNVCCEAIPFFNPNLAEVEPVETDAVEVSTNTQRLHGISSTSPSANDRNLSLRGRPSTAPAQINFGTSLTAHIAIQRFKKSTRHVAGAALTPQQVSGHLGPIAEASNAAPLEAVEEVVVAPV